MIIIEDTRNQSGKHKHINAYFALHGIKVVRSKMLVGDYQIANDGRVAVDTKKDVLELFMNLGKDHQRFRRECELAKAADIQLIILTEEELPGGRIDNWVSPKFKSSNAYHTAGTPKSKANPHTMRKIMITMTKKYGVVFKFCNKEDTGAKVVELLLSGGR